MDGIKQEDTTDWDCPFLDSFQADQCEVVCAPGIPKVFDPHLTKNIHLDLFIRLSLLSGIKAISESLNTIK